MKTSAKQWSHGHIPARPMSEATYRAMRREAEHRMIEWATRQFLKDGGRIRQVKTTLDPVNGQVKGGRSKVFRVAGFHEVEIGEVEG